MVKYIVFIKYLIFTIFMISFGHIITRRQNYFYYDQILNRSQNKHDNHVDRCLYNRNIKYKFFPRNRQPWHSIAFILNHEQINDNVNVTNNVFFSFNYSWSQFFYLMLFLTKYAYQKYFSKGYNSYVYPFLKMYTRIGVIFLVINNYFLALLSIYVYHICIYRIWIKVTNDLIFNCYLSANTSKWLFISKVIIN